MSVSTPFLQLTPPRIKVDVWSDIACPWCYIGKRRFETALARFSQRAHVEVVWHSFELDPSAALVNPGHPREHLAAKYGETPEGAQRMLEQMTQLAKAEGLDFRFDKLRRTNTFQGHQLIHLAVEHGVQGEMKERLLKAHLSEGKNLGDTETLVKLAGEVGLDESVTRAALEAGTYAQSVRHDEAQAQAYGISGVPFFVLNSAYGISGAQSPEVFLSALTQISQEQRPLQPLGNAESATEGCEDGACAVLE